MSLQKDGRSEANSFEPHDVYSGKPHPVIDIFGDEQLVQKIRRFETSETPTLSALQAVFMSNPFRYGVEFSLLCVSKRFLNDCFPDVFYEEKAGPDLLLLAQRTADSPAEVVEKTFDLVPQNLWSEISISAPSIDAERFLEYQAALKKLVPAVDFLVSLKSVRYV